MSVAIVTDSTSDLQNLAGVTIVPLSVSFNQNTFKDWAEINPKQIFEGIAQGDAPPTTSQPSPQWFKEAYDKALQTHKHVLVLTISSGISGTFNCATLASQEFAGKVTVFDSKAASAGLAMMVLRAQEMLASDNSLDGVLVELERIRADFFVQFSVANLDMLRKNGRIGGAQALLGNLLGIKPILSLDHNGAVAAKGKARGEKKVVAEIAHNLNVWAQGRSRIRVFYVYCISPESSGPLKTAIDELNLPLDQSLNIEMGAVIASHVGPGAYGVFAYSY